MDDNASPDPAQILIAAIIKSIADPLTQADSVLGTDMADVRFTLAHNRRTAFGQAEAAGKDRAIIAAEGAIRDLKRNLRAGLFEIEPPKGND